MVMLAEVPDNRVRAGVQAVQHEVVADLDDQLDRRGRRGPRARVRPSRTRLERSVALDPVAGHELGHPAFRDVVVAGNVALVATFDNDGSDNEAGE